LWSPFARFRETKGRVFDVDGLTGGRGSVPLVSLAFLTDAAVVKKILTHLRLPTEPPPLHPARLQEQEDLFPDLVDDDVNQDPGEPPSAPHAALARGPP